MPTFPKGKKYITFAIHLDQESEMAKWLLSVKEDLQWTNARIIQAIILKQMAKPDSKNLK